MNDLDDIVPFDESLNTAVNDVLPIAHAIVEPNSSIVDNCPTETGVQSPHVSSDASPTPNNNSECSLYKCIDTSSLFKTQKLPFSSTQDKLRLFEILSRFQDTSDHYAVQRLALKGFRMFELNILYAMDTMKPSITKRSEIGRLLVDYTTHQLRLQFLLLNVEGISKFVSSQYLATCFSAWMIGVSLENAMSWITYVDAVPKTKPRPEQILPSPKRPKTELNFVPVGIHPDRHVNFNNHDSLASVSEGPVEPSTKEKEKPTKCVQMPPSKGQSDEAEKVLGLCSRLCLVKRCLVFRCTEKLQCNNCHESTTPCGILWRECYTCHNAYDLNNHTTVSVKPLRDLESYVKDLSLKNIILPTKKSPKVPFQVPSYCGCGGLVFIINGCARSSPCLRDTCRKKLPCRKYWTISCPSCKFIGVFSN